MFLALTPVRILIVLFCLLQAVPKLSAQDEGEKSNYSEWLRASRLLKKAIRLIDDYRLDEAAEILKESERVWLAEPRSTVTQNALLTIRRKMGLIWGLQGKYDSAVAVFQRELAFYLDTNQYTYIPITNDLGNLATCYWQKANYRKSIQLNLQALDILAQWSPPDSPKAKVHYNGLGNCYMSLGQYDSALVCYRRGLDLLLTYSPGNVSDVADIYHNLGSVYCSMSRFDSAWYYVQQSLQLCLRTYGESHAKLAPAYSGLAFYYNDIGAFDSALVYQQKVLTLNQQYFKNDDPVLAVYYHNLGFAYHQTGNDKRAVECENKAIELHRKYLGDMHPNLASYYDILSQCYGSLGDPTTAMALDEQALRIRLQTLGETHLSTAYSYHNLASNYQIEKEFNKAVEYLNKALNIFLETLGENHVDVASTYNSLGRCYYRMEDFERAAFYYQKALAIRKKLYPNQHPDIATTLAYLGEALFKTGAKAEGYTLVEQSLAMYKDCLGTKHPDISDALIILADMLQTDDRFTEARAAYLESLYALNYSTSDSLGTVNSLPPLISTLELLATLHQKWYEQTKKPALQLAALKSYREAIEALNYQSRHISLAGKSGLAEKAAALCSGAIGLNHQLKQQTDSIKYWKTAFELAERSKAFLLYEAMQESRARRVAGIPDSLLEEEYNLRVDIASLEKSAWENPHLPANIKSENETKLFNQKRRFAALRELFAKQYPKYYSTRYDLKTITVETVQNQLLQPNQTLLEYTVGDSSLFLFLVQKNHFEVHELDRDSLEQWVDEMTRTGIYGFYTQPEGRRTAALEQATIERYTTRARQLYDKLLAPFQEKLTGELIIIPDGVLGYLPFEALLTGAPGRTGVFSSYPFLLRERQISYCYSATLLREMQDKKHEQRTSNRLLAMAPFATGEAQTLYADSGNPVPSSEFTLRDSLAALKASGDEVAAIAKIWKAKSLLGNAATLEAFRELASRYPILHLSTHGQADDRNGDYAYLAFSAPNEKGVFSKLYTRDLYNLELNADLVVLSACETGTGKLQRGEGIVSLARGVAYAGAKSLITTLWKVNDAKAKDLMVGFYQYLKNGKPKDEALHQAKLDFLAKHQTGGGAALHPFFWAGFIAIGDMRPVN